MRTPRRIRWISIAAWLVVLAALWWATCST